MNNVLKVAMIVAQFEMLRVYTLERKEQIRKWFINDSQYLEQGRISEPLVYSAEAVNPSVIFVFVLVGTLLRYTWIMQVQVKWRKLQGYREKISCTSGNRNASL